MPTLDEQLYRLPLAGWLVRRLYGYFRKHVAATDFFHVLLGLGIGLIIADSWFWGFFFILLSVFYHLHALIHGNRHP